MHVVETELQWQTTKLPNLIFCQIFHSFLILNACIAWVSTHIIYAYHISRSQCIVASIQMYEFIMQVSTHADQNH